MEIEVTQADREAADLAFNVWDNTNELALAFARHRQAAIKERDATIAAEVTLIANYFRKMGMTQVAMSIEAGDYKNEKQNP